MTIDFIKGKVMTQQDYDAMVEYERELAECYDEAYYYSVIDDCVDIINRYGMPTVMKDIIRKLTKDEQAKFQNC
jgi:hypothetical protein